MLRIDRAKKALVSLDPTTMRESGYWERRDLQEMICRSPEAFCNELKEHIWFVGTEVPPTEFVQDRIDLLGVDADGTAVVIEIKRDSHKLQLLQALSYAGMIAKWDPKQFVEELHKFNKRWSQIPERINQTFEDATEELEEFLDEGDLAAINRDQRILLLAEEFDYEVLVTAEWLTERYDADIRCYRIALAKNDGEDFLICTQAYPPPELTDIAIQRRIRRETGRALVSDWPAALKTIANPAVLRFFEEAVANGQSRSVKYRSIKFQVGGRNRFIAYAKRQWAAVEQAGRFGGDMEFWRSRLNDPDNLRPRANDKRLRFNLNDETDFVKFKQAVTTELVAVEFHGADEVGTDESDDEPV